MAYFMASSDVGITLGRISYPGFSITEIDPGNAKERIRLVLKGLFLRETRIQSKLELLKLLNEFRMPSISPCNIFLLEFL